jgi:transposase
LLNAATGELIDVELFVMVLGASNYTYAEVTLSDFVGATIRGFEYFGAVPEVIVPDQLRSAVKGPDRYEPGQRDVPRDGAALRRDRDPRTTAASEGQGEGRDGRAHRAASSNGCWSAT